MPGGGDRCASHVLRSNQGSAAVVAMHAERHSPPLRHRPTVSPHPPFKPAANTRTAPAFPVPQTPLRLPAANWLALRWWLILFLFNNYPSKLYHCLKPASWGGATDTMPQATHPSIAYPPHHYSPKPSSR